jgi:hypothetical protein
VRGRERDPVVGREELDVLDREVRRREGAGLVLALAEILVRLLARNPCAAAVTDWTDDVSASFVPGSRHPSPG